MEVEQDRRQVYVMKDFLVPMTAALILGAGSSFLTVKYNEGATIEWRLNIEAQIKSMKVIMLAVQTNQLELAARGQWMKFVDKDLSALQERVKDIETTHFKKEDVIIENKRLEREIELLWQRMENK